MAEIEVNQGQTLEMRRPLSPHLTVYRPMLTMMMSIAHRITGGALYLGTVLLVWYLLAAATGGAAFGFASWFFGSFVGQLVLFAFTFALLHHFFGGIRHLIWDAGYGFDKDWREYLAIGTLAASVATTLILFIAAHLA
ncbi:succinate dehydrogenase, cytochrome b556 subunit [uncultured Methylovirgula sp.]|uniref:succinate dehydrogenase, cytochrome b556 subunit n=1 Tax=uncultured Methylovirgula sp. TaxID=1285960 RepID=UPI0026149D03|nr:succinate dehydrogenase, cytochrome b556 subunit [uncultured Methylovirgula sp.]